MNYVLPLILAFIATPQASAGKKRALVVGGASKAYSDFTRAPDAPPAIHEFAQSTARLAYGLGRQGYQVTTLFDSVGITPSSRGREARDGYMVTLAQSAQVSLESQHAQLRSMGAQAATRESIVAALRTALNEMSPGDEFEFQIIGHGKRDCGDDVGEKPTTTRTANSDPNCRHVISFSDPVTGFPVDVPTSELVDVIRDMDKKGILTNVTMMSCFSGQAQSLFDGMNNTCVAYLASGNNMGMGCFPNDAEGDPSYTSTLDMVATSHFINYANELRQDPFFRQDPCLEKMIGHYRSNGIGGENRYDLFMSARAHDQAPHEPSLSSQIGQSYFSHGKYSAIIGNLFRGENFICQQPVEDQVQELLQLGVDMRANINAQEVDRLRLQLREKIDRYNALVAEQIATLPPPGATPAQLAQLADLQIRTREAANEVIADERALIAYMNDQILRPALPANDACLRTARAQ